jgi:hypothetical protein
MSSLAKLPKVVGFFSYPRDDDKDAICQPTTSRTPNCFIGWLTGW